MIWGKLMKVVVEYIRVFIILEGREREGVKIETKPI